jgi:hypothetical protein
MVHALYRGTLTDAVSQEVFLRKSSQIVVTFMESGRLTLPMLAVLEMGNCYRN